MKAYRRAMIAEVRRMCTVLPNNDLTIQWDVCIETVAWDGPEATDRRIATASKYVPEFGIATECGIARQRTIELVEELIRIYAECSEEPAATD